MKLHVVSDFSREFRFEAFNPIDSSTEGIATGMGIIRVLGNGFPEQSESLTDRHVAGTWRLSWIPSRRAGDARFALMGWIWPVSQHHHHTVAVRNSEVV